MPASYEQVINTIPDVFQIYIDMRGGGIDSGMDASMHGHILALAFYQETARPTAASTDSLLRGPAQFGPVTFVKPMDRTSPLLLEKLATGEFMPQVIIKFVASSGGDSESYLFHSFELQNVAVSGLRTERLNPEFTDGDRSPVLERVALSYQQIRSRSFPASGSGTDFTWNIEEGGAR